MARKQQLRPQLYASCAHWSLRLIVGGRAGWLFPLNKLDTVVSLDNTCVRAYHSSPARLGVILVPALSHSCTRSAPLILYSIIARFRARHSPMHQNGPPLAVFPEGEEPKGPSLLT